MDPFTLATAGLSAISSLFSGIMGSNAANAQKQALQNAALQAGEEAGVEAGQKLQQGAQAQAHAAVQGAANGGGFVGSTLGVIGQLGRDAMANARTAAYRGATQIQNDIYQSKVAGDNATNSMISGVVGAGSSLLGGWATSAYRASSLKALGSLKGEPDYGYMSSMVMGQP